MYGLELHERFNWKAMALDLHQSFSDTKVSCAYTASLYVHYYLVLNYGWQQKSLTNVANDCTTHQTTALQAHPYLWLIFVGKFLPST